MNELSRPGTEIRRGRAEPRSLGVTEESFSNVCFEIATLLRQMNPHSESGLPRAMPNTSNSSHPCLKIPLVACPILVVVCKWLRSGPLNQRNLGRLKLQTALWLRCARVPNSGCLGGGLSASDSGSVLEGFNFMVRARLESISFSMLPGSPTLVHAKGSCIGASEHELPRCLS